VIKEEDEVKEMGSFKQKDGGPKAEAVSMQIKNDSGDG